jgi:SAM-dependent methyltransferase
MMSPVYDHKQSIKEVIRHVMFRCGMIDALDGIRNLRGQSTGHLRLEKLDQVFSRIYADQIWVGHKGQDSLSGLGSTEHATERLVNELSDFLAEVGCRRLVDVGCGDFNWMRKVQGNFEYLGIDTVAELVKANNENFSSSTRKFVCLDATRAEIPPGDVVVCREVLFHLSFRDGIRLLRNIKAAGFKYVLLTSDKSVWFNSDIRNGDFRLINLSRSPYALPRPDRELVDDKVASQRVLAVWSGSALAV